MWHSQVIPEDADIVRDLNSGKLVVCPCAEPCCMLTHPCRGPGSYNFSSSDRKAATKKETAKDEQVATHEDNQHAHPRSRPLHGLSTRIAVIISNTCSTAKDLCVMLSRINSCGVVQMACIIAHVPLSIFCRTAYLHLSYESVFEEAISVCANSDVPITVTHAILGHISHLGLDISYLSATLHEDPLTCQPYLPEFSF